MEFVEYFTWGSLTLSDLVTGIFLIVISWILNWRMGARRMKHIQYSMVSSIENTIKIFAQTSRYTKNVMDDPEGKLWINYLKRHIEVNHDALQNYYEQMQVNFKEFNTLKKDYAEHIKNIIDETEWTLYDYFKIILITNESDITVYKKLGTTFNNKCSEFFKNVEYLQKKGMINYE